jgi:hypothetical protein
MDNSNSQSGQDILVTKLLNNKKGFFIDVGCWKPIELNNTLLLEQNGWEGISIDILDMSSEWSIRKTKFIKANALETDYTKLFDDNKFPKIVDYLTVDIEGDGHRFLALKKVLESNRTFKIITVEHDSYRGYELSEAIPQRELLTKLGYVLVCKNVTCSGNPFEDWWINPEYIYEELYSKIMCENKEFTEIIKLL